MYRTDDLEIWNLTPDGKTVVGPQKIFNIVGRVNHPSDVERLSYSLNDGPEKPVFFQRKKQDSLRLEKIGDFNIDTIDCGDLKPDNRLTLNVYRKNDNKKEHHISFGIVQIESGDAPEYQLMFDGVTEAEQLGQIVDGKWHVTEDESGQRCLAISNQAAGYDRIILFGHHTWKSDYEISARIRITKWTGERDIGLGLAFKWNPHWQGDGTCLPYQWNTGIGLYYFPVDKPLPGLRITQGVNVHFDENGHYHGENILKQGMLSPWRWAVGSIWVHLLRKKYPIAQIAPGESYRYRMLVSRKKYALTIWRDGKKEPRPQVVVQEAVEQLPRGSVGIIAHHCALSVYEYSLKSLQS